MSPPLQEGSKAIRRPARASWANFIISILLSFEEKEYIKDSWQVILENICWQVPF
jgi:hypothetical protein